MQEYEVAKVLTYIHGSNPYPPVINTCANGHRIYTKECLTCQTQAMSIDRLEEQRISLGIAERARRAEAGLVDS